MKSPVQASFAICLFVASGVFGAGGCVIASTEGDSADDGGIAADSGIDGGAADGGIGTGDGGGAPDAGHPDAGAAMDGGPEDAGAVADAGHPDAGASLDGGSLADAGAPADAGESPQVDGGPAHPDAGTEEDAGPLTGVQAVLRDAGEFELLLDAIETAGLREALQAPGPYTVLAPSDEALAAWPAGAFAALPPAEQENILLYHVLPGDRDTPALFADTPLSTLAGIPISIDVTEAGVIINGLARVFWPNQEASNGIVHGVDAVILPPGQAFPGTIPSFLDAYPRFLRLMEALRLAGLEETLEGAGPFTLFAPTNEAFLNAGIDLQTLPDAELTRLLLRHVVSGNVLAADLEETSELNTVAGDVLPVQIDVGPVLGDNVNVIAADYGCSNGWVHVIDGVLLLPGE